MPSTTSEIHRRWDLQLSDREIHFVGTIFAHWGAIEHEVFMQTIATYVPKRGSLPQLPAALSNVQFTGVLDLWKDRVADKAKGRRRDVLQSQYTEICRLKDARNALAHGKWQWSAGDLGQISTVRVKRRQVITMHFSADDLADFADRLAAINFHLRFPGGIVDLARAQMQEGGYISRRAMAMLTGAPVDRDGYPTAHPSQEPVPGKGADA